MTALLQAAGTLVVLSGLLLGPVAAYRAGRAHRPVCGAQTETLFSKVPLRCELPAGPHEWHESSQQLTLPATSTLPAGTALPPIRWAARR